MMDSGNDMITKDLQRQVGLYEEKLKTLSDLNAAINNNVTEDHLYKLCTVALKSFYELRSLVMFVQEDKWISKIQFGTQKYYKSNMLDENILRENQTRILEKNEVFNSFEEFDVIIPINHKNGKLAIIMLSTIVGVKRSIKNWLVQYVSIYANTLMMAVENKRFGRSINAQEALRKELEIAHNVQNSLFPKELPNSEQLKIMATYLPHHNVGGDYYD